MPGSSSSSSASTSSSTPSSSSGEPDSSGSGSTGSPSPDGWSIEILDTDSTVAGTTSIAVDDDGGVHIAYLDVNGGNDRLRYAFLGDEGWNFSTIDEGRTGWHCSLRLDPSGAPHVSHYAFSDGDLRYSSLDEGEWTTEVVDAAGAVGRKSSLRFDAQGRPRISYHDTSNDDLKYAAHNGSSWSIEVVDSTDAVGDYTALVLDADGNPRIAYYLIVDALGSTGGDLRYAVHDGDAWEIETVDAEGVVGPFVAQVMDADDVAHLSYRDQSNGRLKYAVRDGDDWELEIVDDDGELGDFNTSIALDPDGRPHISYYDADGGELRLASRGDDGWTHVVLDSEHFSGHYSSLAIDDGGTFSLSYSFRHDDSPNPVGPIGLKYAEGR